MDAITLLREDHRTVEKLFKQFEKAGDRAHKTRENLVKKIIEELSIHAAIEEQVFYPAIRDANEDMTLESLEEHHIVKWVLSELDGLSAKNERFVAKVTVLIENVRHHVKEEEQELFPDVRQMFSRKELAELGELLEKSKSIAPTHPHPRAPDEPPSNLAVGMVAGVVDKARDAVSSLDPRT